MQLVILSDTFYSKYYDSNNAYAFFTIGDAGPYYTKDVLVNDPSYVSGDTPRIDTMEWIIIRRNENEIYAGFSRYLRQ